MTVIVCKREQDQWDFAADSSITYGGRIQIIDRDCKLAMPHPDVTILGTGYPEDFALFRIFVAEYFATHEIEENVIALTQMMSYFKSWASDKGRDVTSDGSFSTDYLIRIKNNVYAVEGFHIHEVNRFFALGDGMDLALGAFEMGASAEEAVRIACKYNIYCCEPINIIYHSLSSPNG